MLNDNARDNLLVSLQFNLARSEELHAALKQEGCVTLMTKVLAQAPQTDGAQHEVRVRSSMLCHHSCLKRCLNARAYGNYVNAENMKPCNKRYAFA